ncbi:hypothetical protein QBC39DRAFT_326070 [Podospora conica]|nr:hypothetical protein QBC39DRAFT_326070 [Schizothecium conicum]
MTLGWTIVIVSPTGYEVAVISFNLPYLSYPIFTPLRFNLKYYLKRGLGDPYGSLRRGNGRYLGGFRCDYGGPGRSRSSYYDRGGRLGLASSCSGCREYCSGNVP